MFHHLPQLNNIRVFEAAARLGSFKAAGEELNVTPTAISHQISNLEDKLGVLLFERKTRSVKLTQEGVRLSFVAHQALQKLSTIIEELSDTQSVLRVATTTSFASMWLVPNLESFYKKHPEIQVEIKTAEELVDIKQDRRIDIAIRYGCIDKNDGDTTKLVTDSFKAYATQDYLDRSSTIGNMTFIETKWKNNNLPPVSWTKWLRTFHPEIDHPEVRQFDQEHHVVQAALAGQGVALVSSVLVKMAVDQGWLKLFQRDCSLPGLTYYILSSPFNKDLRKVIVFREWLMAAWSGEVTDPNF